MSSEGGSSKSATIEMYAPSSYNETVNGETLSSISEKSESYSQNGSNSDYAVSLVYPSLKSNRIIRNATFEWNVFVDSSSRKMRPKLQSALILSIRRTAKLLMDRTASEDFRTRVTALWRDRRNPSTSIWEKTITSILYVATHSLNQVRLPIAYNFKTRWSFC